MARQEYNQVLETSDSDFTFTDTTADITGHRSTVTIATNTDTTAKIMVSTNGTDFNDLTGYASIDVNTTSYSVTVRITKFMKVGVKNDGVGETDSVAVAIVAISETPVYCSAVDVAKYLGWTKEDGDTQPPTVTRFEFTASTLPTLAEVNEMILSAEDFIDEFTEHAWRERRIVNEFQNYQFGFYAGYHERVRESQHVSLSHRIIRALVSGTDKIEIWDGSTYTDLVATGTEGRAQDYDLDAERGIIFFKSQRPTRVVRSVRVTYGYGEQSVAEDINTAAALIVARKIMMAHDHLKNIPDGPDAGSIYRTKLGEWQKEIDRILSTRKEAIWVR